MGVFLARLMLFRVFQPPWGAWRMTTPRPVPFHVRVEWRNGPSQPLLLHHPAPFSPVCLACLLPHHPKDRHQPGESSTAAAHALAHERRALTSLFKGLPAPWPGWRVHNTCPYPPLTTPAELFILHCLLGSHPAIFSHLHITHHSLQVFFLVQR